MKDSDLYTFCAQTIPILRSQVVSLPLQSVIQKVANFCAAMDTLIDQDGANLEHFCSPIVTDLLNQTIISLCMV